MPTPYSQTMLQAIVHPTTLNPKSFELKRQELYKTEIEETCTRMKAFMASVDLQQFCQIFKSDFPAYGFLKTFNVEHFEALALSAFEIVSDDASDEKLSGTINAVMKLDEELSHIQHMFMIYKTVGLHDNGVGLCLALLTNLNQQYYSQLKQRQIIKISSLGTPSQASRDDGWHPKQEAKFINDKFSTGRNAIDVQTARERAAQRRLEQSNKLKGNGPFSNSDPLRNTSTYQVQRVPPF